MVMSLSTQYTGNKTATMATVTRRVASLRIGHGTSVIISLLHDMRNHLTLFLESDDLLSPFLRVSSCHFECV